MLVHGAGDVIDRVRETHTALVDPPNDIHQAEKAILVFIQMSANDPASNG